MFTTPHWMVALVALGGCGSSTRGSIDVDVYVEPLGPTLDRDQDGILDQDERRLGTDLDDPDSDGDGIEDGAELLGSTDPLSPDTDNDAVMDGTELELQLDPTNPDTDGGGAWDGDELLAGTDPSNPLDDLVRDARFVGGGGCAEVRQAMLLLPLGLFRRRVRR